MPPRLSRSARVDAVAELRRKALEDGVPVGVSRGDAIEVEAESCQSAMAEEFDARLNKHPALVGTVTTPGTREGAVAGADFCAGGAGGCV